MNGLFTDWRYYCYINDRPMARISMVNSHGHELFMIIPDEGGKKYREARAEALEQIEHAVARGQAPGEVMKQTDRGEPT